MAFNNSQDSEFDPEMERILHEHFDAEDSELQSPGDPWQLLQSRMEEPDAPSFFPRFLGGLNPLREFRVSPAFAGAAVAVVAVAVVATVWAVSGNGGPDSSGGMAALPPTEMPAQTALAVPTESLQGDADDERTGEPTAVAAEAAETATEPASEEAERDAVSPTTPEQAPTTVAAQVVPTPTPAPQPTARPAEEEMMESEAEAERAAVPTPAPYATAVPVPSATTAPAMEAAMRGPRGTPTPAAGR